MKKKHLKEEKLKGIRSSAPQVLRYCRWCMSSYRDYSKPLITGAMFQELPRIAENRNVAMPKNARFYCVSRNYAP